MRRVFTVSLASPSAYLQFLLSSAENIVLERGEDYVLLGRMSLGSDDEGRAVLQTSEFTVLENGLNYFEDGEWKPSEDVIEPYAGGAIARRGPHKAIFSDDLNREAVFDIQTQDNKRLRGGVRGIFLTDRESGLRVTLGRVKESAAGKLVGANEIVYEDAFDGCVRADVILRWRHNSFSHDIVLKSRPVLPADMKSETTRLEMVTEFVEAPEAEIRSAEGEIDDHAFIGFGALAIITGYAYPVGPEEQETSETKKKKRHGTIVTKRWERTPEGRTLLVESVGWNDLLPHLEKLEPGENLLMEKPTKSDCTCLPRAKEIPTERKPMRVAKEGFEPKGYLIDFEIVTNQSKVATFEAGKTYVVVSNYYVGGRAVFEPGCVIKLWGNNLATITAFGSISFPETFQSVIFTSLDDDAYGERIPGNSDPFFPGSDGNPADNDGDDNLRVWYMREPTEVRNAVFRWAMNGIEYFKTGPGADHVIRNCRFEKMGTFGATAVQLAFVPPARKVTLVNSEKWDVHADVSGASSPQVSGSLSEAMFYTPVSFRGMRRNDTDDHSVALPSAPDTMGAVGPEHFVELLNISMAIFDKGGARILTASSMELFQVPTGTLVDPRISYDHQTNRWVAVAMHRLPNVPAQLRFAVSSGPNPVPLAASNWSAWTLNVGEAGFITDFPTLGMDRNGYYVAVHLYKPDLSNPTEWKQKLVAIRKPPGGGAIGETDIYYPETGLAGNCQGGSYKWMILQPVVNFDTTLPADGSAWFLAKDAPLPTGGKIRYGELKWGSSSPTVTFHNAQLDILGTYHDLDEQTTPDSRPPQRPSTNNERIALGAGTVGSRLMCAFARKIQGTTYIWTCHHVGVNAHGAAMNADRSAAQWAQLYVRGTDGLGLVDSAKVFDSDANAAEPYFFYHPSLAVNSDGVLLMGYSGSKASEYIGAFYSGFLWESNKPTRRPTLLQAGRHYYNSSNWGHYSHTTIDPTDGSFWTVQEYAETGRSPDTPATAVRYGTWITQVKVRKP